MAGTRSERLLQDADKWSGFAAACALPLMITARCWDSWFRAAWTMPAEPPHHEGCDQLEVPEPFEKEGEPGLFA